MCCKKQCSVCLWQRMSEHCAPFMVNIIPYRKIPSPRLRLYGLTYPENGQTLHPQCHEALYCGDWFMWLCGPPTNLCKWCQMSRMYLTSLMPSFCILSSNRNVAYSISLNGILSQCVSCELLLHWSHRCAVIPTLIDLPKRRRFIFPACVLLKCCWQLIIRGMHHGWFLRLKCCVWCMLTPVRRMVL